jgi:hypothetical protein
MAQPGNFTPILLYGSSTPGNAPVAANLTNSATGSEIAINVADKNLFFKDSGGVVNTVPIRQSSASSNGWLSSTDWSTFNGKQAALVSGTNIKTVGGVSLLGSGDVGAIGVAYGGTGLTSLTASYIPYGNGTSAFSSTANFNFNGTTLGIATGSSTGALNLSTSGSNTSLQITDTGASGANIRLYGDGATTPNKAIRAIAGSLQVLNSAYSAYILNLDDSGNLAVPGTFSSSSRGISKSSMPAGTVLQVVNAVLNTDISGITSLTTVLSATITPTSSTSTILVIAQVCADIAATTNALAFLQLYRGATYTYVSTVAGNSTAVSALASMSVNYLDGPNTTSAVTYNLKMDKGSGGTASIDVYGAGNAYRTQITLMEIAA